MTSIHEAPAIAVERPASDRRQIGSAQMEQDGTIILRVRMVSGAAVGDAEIRCVPGSADYGRVRQHLPTLTPGTSVPLYNGWD